MTLQTEIEKSMVHHKEILQRLFKVVIILFIINSKVRDLLMHVFVYLQQKDLGVDTAHLTDHDEQSSIANLITEMIVYMFCL